MVDQLAWLLESDTTANTNMHANAIYQPMHAEKHIPDACKHTSIA